jgi:hypothetical protein
MAAAVVLVLAAYLAAWFVVELVAPPLFFLFYVVVLRAGRRAVALHADAQGRLGWSIASGTLWATVYVVPLSLVVLLVHAALRARGHH